MMIVTFIGDPRGRDPKFKGFRADDPAFCEVFGESFPLNRAKTVSDEFAKEFGAKLRGNPHFDVKSEADAAAEEAAKAAEAQRVEDERKAQETARQAAEDERVRKAVEAALAAQAQKQAEAAPTPTAEQPKPAPETPAKVDGSNAHGIGPDTEQMAEPKADAPGETTKTETPSA